MECRFHGVQGTKGQKTLFKLSQASKLSLGMPDHSDLALPLRCSKSEMEGPGWLATPYSKPHFPSLKCEGGENESVQSRRFDVCVNPGLRTCRAITRFKPDHWLECLIGKAE